MFERTISGQQNRAVFYNADAVCYVEGGGGVRDTSVDKFFWETIFSICLPGRRVRCVARGGKPELETLANSIISQDVKNTFVAMDSDYDGLLGEIIQDSRVIYTHGYSWENDCYSKENMKTVYCSLLHCDLSRDEEDLFDRLYESLERDLIKFAIADFIGLQARSSLVPRSGVGRIIGVDDEGFPRPKYTEILKLLRQLNIRTRPRQPVRNRGPRNVSQQFVGHVMAFYIRLGIKWVARQSGYSFSATGDHIRDIGLLCLRQLFVGAPNHPIVVHYTRRCAMIPL